MALTNETRKNLYLAFAGVVLVAGGTLLYWIVSMEPSPVYSRDPRAPNICYGRVIQGAFRVPCEDIPPELIR